ncbi:hypothetical protein BU17DRAFT_86929 [Hysterangium stoloniferum]|nr:hypothetical protein BU17DRAFT_86929 [Hysterangium stoloniferum]
MARVEQRYFWWYILSAFFLQNKSDTTTITVREYAYTSRGPLALTVAAGISLCSVTAVLLAILIDGFRTRHQFVRSQVGACFLSLVLSDLLQAAGSVMNLKWVLIEGVEVGHFCTTQAALKQTGNIGIAIWSLIIALHTFFLLFLRLRISNSVFSFILGGAWALIGFIVMIGPVIIQNSARGPFWGISVYWCWITDKYHIEQFTNEYLFMFITVFSSFILYSLIFLRLRGNLSGYGNTFRLQRATTPWMANHDNSQMAAVGKQMLWYPVAYAMVVLPIAVCRWMVIFGHPVPYTATMVSDSIFVLSGFVNAILYSTTRKIVSLRALLPFSRLLSRRSLSISSKGSLDDMKFAPPVFSREGRKPPEGIEDVISRRGSDYPGDARAEFLQKPVDFMSHDIDSPRGTFSEKPALSVSVVLPSPAHTRAPIHSHPHDHSNSQTPIDVAPTPTTDGAPSVHRKCFSGWGFPSVRDGLQAHDSTGDLSEGLSASLEEMRFATPSPPNVAKQAPAQ